jgi:hypothetical protein
MKPNCIKQAKRRKLSNQIEKAKIKNRRWKVKAEERSGES